MKLTYRFKIKENKSLNKLSKISKELYNQANYIVRQEFINNKKYLNYYSIDKIMKETKNLESKINYKLLPAQSSQQILRLLDKNWKSFFKSIKDWVKNKGKYSGRPNLPSYIKKEKHLLILTNQNSEIINNRIKNKKFNINIRIPKYKIKDKDGNISFKDFTNFHQIRILPRNNYYVCEIVYEESTILNCVDKNKILSIDLGINNLITMVTNFNEKPIIVNGRILKSINQWYNKKIGKLKSIRTNGKDVRKDKEYFKNTKQIIKLTEYRNDTINDYLNKISKFVVDYCVKKGIGVICVGELKGLKTSIKLCKRQNQQITQIPLNTLKNKLKYKAELNNIEVRIENEAYTSKCDALGLEEIKKHETYLGQRICRGLFKSVRGLINADVNGALNILRKVIGDGFISLLDRAILFNPIKIREFHPNSLKQFLLKC